MTTTIITGIVGLCTTVASSFITWFLSKRKYNAEVDNNVIQNMQATLEFYKTLSDDNRKRLDIIMKRDIDLTDEVSKLKAQLSQLTSFVCTELPCKARRVDFVQLYQDLRETAFKEAMADTQGEEESHEGVDKEDI